VTISSNHAFVLVITGELNDRKENSEGRIMLTLLTATGARPAAWAICERLMMAQTYDGPVHWIIVDDGQHAQPVTFKRDGWKLSVISPLPHWNPGHNTQARNLGVGALLVKPDDKLVIIEDDDYYHKDWLVTIDRWLNDFELAGECEARYYNINTKIYRKFDNQNHASLCSTGMTGKAIEQFKSELKPDIKFIDINLWKNFQGSKLLKSTNLTVGMKGLPGRAGIGVGHKKHFNGKKDINGDILAEWLGEDKALYI
jgi:glycosyltransferase involved in cell wall biosynthesis